MMNRTILSTPDVDATSSDDTSNDQQQGASAPQGAIRATVRRIIVIVFLMALAATGSRAQSTVSITASPLHLSKSIAQVTGELKLIDNVSIAGVAGLGRRDGEQVWVGGGQVRVYLVGGFDNGLHVGAEALYTELGSASSIEGILNVMNGAAAGPFVGYKLVLPFGLTLDLQGGLRYSEGRIRMTGGESGGATGSDEKLGPLANINVGWSF